MTGEERKAAMALWLSRWQGWRSSGLSMAAYGRQEGFDAYGAYRWRRTLRRTGQWIEEAVVTAAKPRHGKAKGAVRFARVALQDAAIPTFSMLVRLTLGNGRRAELEVSGAAQFAELIGVLERAA